MSDQQSHPVTITEPWPRQRSRYLIVSLLVVFVAAIVAAWFDTSRLAPLQAYYLRSYLAASVASAGETGTFDHFNMMEGGRTALPLLDDVESDGTGFRLTDAARQRGAYGLTNVHGSQVPKSTVYRMLREIYFHNRSLPCAFPVTLWTLGVCLPLAFVIGPTLDHQQRKKLLRGVVRRGPCFVNRADFNRFRKSDGIGFRTGDSPTIREWIFTPAPRRCVLAIPTATENSHLLVMGDSGTGKSVLLRQLLRGIRDRGEVAVVYDPAGEFAAEFYNPDRGDIILNPLDQRMPFWQPAGELQTNPEALTLADSLLPDLPSETANQFFVRAPRKIFAHLLQYNPDPETLAYWLSMPHEIDRRVAGTEMAQMLNKGAAAQRAGVLASLGMIADSFRLLPTREETTSTWTAREWAAARKGWIFLTCTTTTRKAQLPLMSMWLDTLVLRLMTGRPGAALTPVWMVIDELASLQRLPQLQTAMTEARKYRLRMVLGFQGAAQIQALYTEKGAETLLSQAQTKIFLRTNDPNAAEWISRSLGEQDVERVRETRSVSEGFNSKNNQSYVRELRTERAVTAAQIQGLAGLHGYLKQENFIVPFLLPILPAEYNYPPIVHREQITFTPLVLPVHEDPVPEPAAAGEQTEPVAESPAAATPSGETLVTLDHCLRAAPVSNPSAPAATPGAAPPLGPPDLGAPSIPTPTPSAVSESPVAVPEDNAIVPDLSN